MIYLIAIFCPPLAVLIKGKPKSALLNIFLCFLYWIPGMIHALIVVHESESLKSQETLKMLKNEEVNMTISNSVSLIENSLKRNMYLKTKFLEKYIQINYHESLKREGFWNKFFHGAGFDPEKISSKITEINNNYKNQNVDELIKAVFLGVESPIKKNFGNINFLLKDKMLIFNEALPNIDILPDYKDTAVNSKGDIKYTPFKKGEKKELFFSYYNQVALAVTNLLFQADTEGLFEEICYNGWIKTKSKTTGKDIEACVVSLSVSREKFMDLNLEHVDPIECVKSLHGRTEQDLESPDIEGIKPFLKFDLDKKIVEANSIIDEVKSNNLMDLTWEEFEIYVRDWLKKEFVNAKVEVTQSSRDGGIDAIIYDDDFLKGGVTVVQVKQYNITVPVSAVRDLYGVMQDRRASKGILVTTSDFGYDSRQFVKDKPISLVNGTNLLYYLTKHGYNVEIKRRVY
jgi:restriction system protein